MAMMSALNTKMVQWSVFLTVLLLGIFIGSSVTVQETFFLFDDITYSKYDHQYWDNYELENDVDRIVIP